MLQITGGKKSHKQSKYTTHHSQLGNIVYFKNNSAFPLLIFSGSYGVTECLLLRLGEKWKSKCTLRDKDVEGQTEYWKQNEQLWGEKGCEMRDTDSVPEKLCTTFMVIPLPQSDLYVVSLPDSCLSVTSEGTNYSLSVWRCSSSAQDEAALWFICVLIKFCHVTSEDKDSAVGNSWILKGRVAGCLSAPVWWPSSGCTRTPVSCCRSTCDWPNL